MAATDERYPSGRYSHRAAGVSRRALVIQHIAVETLGANFSAVLADAGFATIPLLAAGAGSDGAGRFAPPAPAELDLIVSLGGPQSANDRNPALQQQEIEYLRAAAAGDPPVPVVGVCLGAQLLARALGGAVAATGGYQFGLRKIEVTAAGAADPAFREVAVPLVPTLHGERFSVPPGAALLATGTMLRRDGSYVCIPMAFRSGLSYGFQFEPQLTCAELRVWNRELAGDYALMGDRFDPREEAARNLREFTAFAPYHERQMARLLRAILRQAGLGGTQAK